MKHEISASVEQLKLSHGLTHAEAVAVASDTKKLVELMEERDFEDAFKGVA